ncbi:MAG: peptidase C39 [Acutalibacteraceae bacterium]
MKVPLHYQLTEYDCGPTSVLNAIAYLFDREDIPPEIIRNVMLFTLDCRGTQGENCKGGTSHMAMMYLSNWLNGYGKTGQFPLFCDYISGSDVFLGEGSCISSAVKDGAVAVLRLHYDVWHYVLMTGEKDGYVYLFDPYYDDDEEVEKAGIVMDYNHPYTYNRIVPLSFFDKEDCSFYALGKIKSREAVIVHRS